MFILVLQGASVDVLKKHGWHRMIIDRRIKPYPGERWAFDNGAYSFYRRGIPFQWKTFFKRLKMILSIGEPYFAVAPDVVKGGLESLSLSNYWMEYEKAGIISRWYLAVQEGMPFEAVEKAITTYNYAGLFLGSPNRFKLETGEIWRDMCYQYGIKFHYGRCGRRHKIRHAKYLKADSIDTALPIYAERALKEFEKALEDAEIQCSLQQTT